MSFLERLLQEASQETKDHCDRLKSLAVAMGERLGLRQSELNELALLASLHDVGKVAVPRSILLKPGELTEEEWGIVKSHPEVGFRIMRSIDHLAPISEGVLHHHERWDGTGYPRGVKGEEIPLSSRIIAIVDAFDAIISDRPYRKPRSRQEAIEEIRRCSGTQFDPALVPVFLNVLAQETEQAVS